MKRIISLLLALVLVAAVFPLKAGAQQSQWQSLRGDAAAHPKSRTGAAGPVLSEGRHENYLDRITGLPDYALEFYNWLEDNANAQGALADPTRGPAYGSDYYHKVATITGTRTFNFTNKDELEAMAAEVAQDALYQELDIFNVYAGAIYSVFDRENPQVFWLSGRSKYGALGGYAYGCRGNTCTVYYELEMVLWLKSGSFDVRNTEYQNPAAIARDITRRDEAVQEILAGCTATEPYEQLQYLNLALAQRCAYNQAMAEGRLNDVDPEAWECISALTGRVGDHGPVCEGYARAFMLLCRELGIPCVLADGNARTTLNGRSEEHMWNCVQLDGQWYAVDVSWNDPYAPGAPERACSGYETDAWLLLGSGSLVAPGMTFAQSHLETNDIAGTGLCYTNGPVLSTQAYVPSVGYSLSGTVLSFGDEIAPVTLELQAGERTVIVTVTGNEQLYQFDDLDAGSYTLMVKKPNHAPREYAITLEGNMSQDLKIHLKGDINGDGKLNIADTAKIYAHVKDSNPLTDYAFACGDVDGNGKVNVADTSKAYSHVKGAKPLW